MNPEAQPPPSETPVASAAIADALLLAIEAAEEGGSAALRLGELIEARAAGGLRVALHAPACGRHPRIARKARDLQPTLMQTYAADLLSNPAGAARRAAAAALLRHLEAALPCAPASGGVDDGPAAGAAAAWRGCRGALGVVLRFEEPEVIRAVIEFFRRASGALDGSRLADGGPTAAAGAGTMGAQQVLRADAAQQPADHARRYVEWLWRAGPGLLAAVVARVREFAELTGGSGAHGLYPAGWA